MVPSPLSAPCVTLVYGPLVRRHLVVLSSNKNQAPFPRFIPFYFKLTLNEVNTFLVGAPFNVGGAPCCLTSWKEEKVISVAGVMTRRRLVNGLWLKRD